MRRIFLSSGAVVVAITASIWATAQTTAAPVARFAAATANLKGGPDSVRIDILAWSTDAARSQLVDAWNLIAPAPAVARGARGTRGTPEAAGEATAPPAPTRGARGGTRGAPPAGIAAAGTAPARNTPEGSLSAALQAAESVGYLWTSESTGYSLRYAYRLPQPGGGERIILATDRRLGVWDDSWKPLAGMPSDYAFSIIELRLNAKHEGEGKASLAGKVAIDTSANTIALEDYSTLPVTLKDVRLR